MQVPPSSSPTSSQHRTITRLEECLDIGEGPSPKDWCPSYHTCHACAAIPGCTWDIDKNSRCKETSRRKPGQPVLPSPAPTENSKTSSNNNNNTTASTMDDIDNDAGEDSDDESESVIPEEKRRDIFSPFDQPDHISTCSPPCSERTSCSNCTHGLCMWCKNLEMCIERNAYLVKILKYFISKEGNFFENI